MAKLTILGNDKPIIGKDEMYSISAFDTMLNLSVNVLQPKKLNEKIQWAIMVQTKTGWRDGGSHKEGPYAPYKFGQPSLAHKGIKIVVKRGDDSGELIVHPQRAKEPKITKIELLDANYKPIPKGKKISYKDTIIARAHCVEMFRMQVAFTLWEDDAEGQGHNAKTNALNKINPIPSFGYVNEKGIAEAIFRLPMYTMAVQIANARIASGDQSEGSTHEYYVTADVVDAKIQKASPNVNVANPTYTPPPPRTKPKTSTTRPPAKPKTAEKSKPKPDSAKFPVTTGGKSQSDRQGKILSAEFVDNSGNRVHSSRVGNKVWVKISTQNMKGKKVTVKIWEEDFKGYHDLLFAKDYQLNYDDNLIWVVLTNRMFLKGKDRLEGYSQEYFIEVIHKETSVTSQAIDVNATAAPTTVPKTRTTAEVNQPPQQKKSSTCLCQEQYKDLFWGGKVSCEFRKKVVQICSELWGESRKMEMANGLMAVMSVETRGSFKAQQLEGWRSVKEPGEMSIKDFWKDGNRKSSRAIGLIQFTQDALQNNLKEYKSNPNLSIEQRFDELNKLKLKYAQMGEIKQLDKVKKYFEPQKSNIKSAEDIYLAVFAPTGVGKKDDYVLYQKYNNPTSDRESTSTKNYKANESVDTKSNGINKNDGKIQRSEILERFHNSKNEGSQTNNLPKVFNCSNDKQKSLSNAEPGFYIYRNGEIKYIESESNINYYIQKTSGSNEFKKITTLTKNSHGVVKFPDSGLGFDRYGGVDKGGSSTKETVGTGDHYVLPKTAAALFGLTNDIYDRGWEIHFGDMSSQNGSDPWQKGYSHHAGHGHMGNRKGIDVDFRYLNKAGKSFHGLNTSSSFDNSKNKTVFELAYKYGFQKNYASGMSSYASFGVNPKVKAHYDHGHFGLSNINLETVTSVDVKITN